jgi:hypothetical protein
MFDTLDFRYSQYGRLRLVAADDGKARDDPPTTPEEYLEPEFRDRVEMPELKANSS